VRSPKETPPRLPGETAHYEDDPFELGAIEDSQLVQVADFLPRPEELVFRPKGVKVTITLNEESIDFFKAEAKRLQVPYQRMIRNLLDEYVARIKQAEQKHTAS
jgi:predicted DNA binding CopG/RHH family protein